MPYLVHPNADTPADDTEIWRYMELPQFLMLLEESSIYFALKKELQDRWEFAMTAQMSSTIATQFGEAASGGMVSLFNDFTNLVAVSCWHQNSNESIAMWNLYTHEGPGIAIKTSIGRLKTSLAAVPEDIYIGKVRYENHDAIVTSMLAPSEVTPLRNVLQKRTCFEHEREIRAFLPIGPPLPEAPVLGQVFTYPYPEVGVSVAIDLKVLVEKIVVSPYFPRWALPVIHRAIRRAGISPLVELSTVSSAPNP